MKVLFFDLKRLYSKQKKEIDSTVLRVLDSGWYIHGQEGLQFEKNFSTSLFTSLSEPEQTAGVTVGCNSGTDALILSLLASGIQAGDEVITVSHTALPTVTAIYSTGATPKFIDIDPQTWLLDPNQIKNALSPWTKAVIAVHLYGNMVNIPALKAELQKLGREDISIIEDVAQAHGSQLNDLNAGTLGRMGAFSFYPTKNLGALGDAGAVYCSNSKDGKNVRMLANYGQESRYQAKLPQGINSRLDEVQAAILNLRLNNLTESNTLKEHQMALYQKELQGLPLRFQVQTTGCKPAWHLCVVQLESEKIRNSFVEFLKEEGIETVIHYPTANHLQAAFSAKVRVSLPVTESLTKQIVSLPMNSVLLPEEQEAVIRAIRKFFKSSDFLKPTDK